MKSWLQHLSQQKQTGIALAASALFLFFSIFTSSFLAVENLFSISRNMAFYIFIGLSQAVVMATGGMNVSMGAIGGLATVVIGVAITKAGLPGGVAIVAGLLAGVLCGLFNGLVIAKLRINDFIVTLSTSFIFTGINYGVSKGFPYTAIPDSFTVIGRGDVLGIPILLLVVVATLILAKVFFESTITGRHILAVGSNASAARLSGVKVDRMRIISHAISGFLAALTGYFYVSRMGSAQPAAGQNWLIISFSVAVIGSTALSGGVLSPFGLFLGGVIMVLIKNGLILMNANVYLEQAFIGVVILLIVALDALRTRNRQA
jgi:ribose transport system permease protein